MIIDGYSKKYNTENGKKYYFPVKWPKSGDRISVRDPVFFKNKTTAIVVKNNEDGTDNVPIPHLVIKFPQYEDRVELVRPSMYHWIIFKGVICDSKNRLVKRCDI